METAKTISKFGLVVIVFVIAYWKIMSGGIYHEINGLLPDFEGAITVNGMRFAVVVQSHKRRRRTYIAVKGRYV